MLRTRHLLPLLILLVSGCFQPLFAGQIDATVERAELPIVLASVYDHWEKDLQPFSTPSSTYKNMAQPDHRKADEVTPYLLLTVLLIAVGVIVVGDASKFQGPASVRGRRSGGEEPLKG